MPYRYDCIHICRVWYELFEKQMKYYTLFSVLRWEFASVNVNTERFYENIIQEARFETLNLNFFNYLFVLNIVEFMALNQKDPMLLWRLLFYKLTPQLISFNIP